MKSLSLFLFGLLSSVQAQETWKGLRGHRISARSVGLPYGVHGPSGGDLPPPSAQVQDALTAMRVGNFLHGGADHTAPSDGRQAIPVTDANDPVGFEAIRNFANDATAAIETYGPGNIPTITGATGAVNVGGVRVPGPVAGPLPISGPASAPGPNYNGGPAYAPAPNYNGAPPYDFNTVMQNLMNIATPGGNPEAFMGPMGLGHGGDGRAPSVFNYQPSFGGGRDFNHLPHVLPPGGKNIQQLQAEADEQLRLIIAKAHERQRQTLDRVNRLQTQYGIGTIGFSGYKDTFNRTEHIDLGTYRGRDLGTSIDASQLFTADGKLKLPVQNIWHKKTVGIKIPQPYPVKHEVAVPAPYPVHHYIRVPTPTTATVVQQPAPQIIVTPPRTSYALTPPAPQINVKLNGASNYNTVSTNNVNDDSSEEEYNTIKGNSYSIDTSKAVSPVSSAGVTSLLTSAPVNAIVNSYGPPPSGPVGSMPSLSSFFGNVGLSSFPPLNSLSKFMGLSKGKAQY